MIRMFEAEYLLYCAGKSTDERGNLTLHSIFDRIYFERFPGQQKPFQISFRLRAKRAVINKHLKFQIIAELDDKELNRLDGEGDFTVEKDNGLSLTLDVSQFVFPKPGNYMVKLTVNNTTLMARSLSVRSTSDLIEK